MSRRTRRTHLSMVRSRTARFATSACVAGLLVVTMSSAAAAQPRSSADEQPSEPTIRVEAAESGDAADEAAAIVAGMSTAEKAAAVIMSTVATRDPEVAASFVSDAGLGGFILMGSNVGYEEQVRQLSDAISASSDLPPLVAVDQEGGVVTRLYWDRAPTATALRPENAAAAEAAFAWRGAVVARAGITVNFGIVADTTDDRSSFIFRRVLGTTVSDATSKVAAAVTGESDAVASTIKHFPGHGTVTADSHYTVPVADLTESQWRSRVAPPFNAGIAAGAELVMSGHLIYPAVDSAPASLSSVWYDKLRDDLGFTGVAVTDDLGMLVQSGEQQYADPVANAVAALGAGADLLLMIAGADADTVNATIAGIEQAVSDGRVPEERLTEAAQRVVELRLMRAGEGRSMLACDDPCEAPAT